VTAASPPTEPPQHEGAAAQRAAATARKHVLEIARRHFGEPARRVFECGGGLTNAVYQFKVSQGEFIVRTHQDPTKIQQYLKEQWAMDVVSPAHGRCTRHVRRLSGNRPVRCRHNIVIQS
jgi:Ser/Thr protein kinase RdoA (MazF antagonist)